MASSNSQGQAHLPPSPTPSLHTSSLLYPMAPPAMHTPRIRTVPLPNPQSPECMRIELWGDGKIPHGTTGVLYPWAPFCPLAGWRNGYSLVNTGIYSCLCHRSVAWPAAS